jgi:hypothetical protein
MEAMAMGVPVIATNWSGNTAFMTADNSLLLRVEKMVEIATGPFKGHLWAEPSKDHLVELMLEAVRMKQQRLRPSRPGESSRGFPMTQKHRFAPHETFDGDDGSKSDRHDSSSAKSMLQALGEKARKDVLEKFDNSIVVQLIVDRTVELLAEERRKGDLGIAGEEITDENVAQTQQFEL